MFSFINDICFMEELKENGFDHTYCLTVVDNKNFMRVRGKMGYMHISEGIRCLKEKYANQQVQKM